MDVLVIFQLYFFSIGKFTIYVLIETLMGVMKMIEEELSEKSKMLDITVDKLIDRYIRRGLYKDLFYGNTPLTKHRLSEVVKIDKSNRTKRDMDNSLVDIYICPE